MQSEPEIVVDAANELGEGVVWSPAHREVQWTDIFGRHFWAYRPEDGQRQSWPLPDRLACFAPLGGRSLLAGFAGGLEVFDLESGARRQIAPIEPDRPTTRLNDGKLDRKGRLVFGTMDEDPTGPEPIGQIWSYEAGSEPRALVSGVRISNSIAFSPDGRRMYFADTPERRIRCYDYDVGSGELSSEWTFALVKGPGFPDGSTVDADGCLWNAEWGGGRVVRYTPAGRVDRVLRAPMLPGHLLCVWRRQSRSSFRNEREDGPRCGRACVRAVRGRALCLRCRRARHSRHAVSFPLPFAADLWTFRYSLQTL